MHAQNYANHRRLVPMYHYVLFGLVVATLVGSCINLVQSLGSEERLHSGLLIVALSVIVFLLFFFMRIFALKAQDRAIRAEENLRHFALTGTLLDPRLQMRQIIGLRFASDEDLVALARRSADENLTEDAIKRAVKNRRGDDYRA